MRSPARTSDLTFLLVCGVATVALTALSFVIAPPETTPRDSGSSYAPAPYGAKAAFLLLQGLGYQPDRSFDPIALLAADPARSVLVLADPLLESSEQDRAALLRFADGGGTVLAAGPSAAAFLPRLTERRRPGAREVRTYLPAFPSALARQVPSVRMTSPGSRVRGDIAVWLPVFVEGGEPGVLVARRGAGQLIWWASSRPLSNGAISEPGHLELLLNAIGSDRSRRILWDESYHGRGRSLWSHAAGTPVAWGLAQLGLCAGVALFTFGRYVGPARSRAVVPRTSPLEFIDTMGGLYQRAHPAGAAVSTARSHVRRLLLERARIPASSSDERLASALAARFPVSAQEVLSLLERSAGAGRPGAAIKESEAVAMVRQLLRLAAVMTTSTIAASRQSARPHPAEGISR